MRLFLFVLLFSITAQAAPKQVRTRLRVPGAWLDNPQKEALGNAVVAVVPKAIKDTEGVELQGKSALVKVRNFNCRHKDNDMSKGIGCDGWYKDRKTIDEIIDLQIEGVAGPALDEGAPEGFVDFWHLINFTLADTVAQGKLDLFVKATFVGLQLSDLYNFRCTLDEKDDTRMACESVYEDIVSAATHHTLNKARVTVGKPLGRVP